MWNNTRVKASPALKRRVAASSPSIMNGNKEVAWVCGVPLIHVQWFPAQMSCFPTLWSLFLGQHSRRDSQATNKTGLNCEREPFLEYLWRHRRKAWSSLPSIIFVVLLVIPTCFPFVSPESSGTRKRTAGVEHIERRVEWNRTDCGLIRRDLYEKWSACNYVSG